MENNILNNHINLMLYLADTEKIGRGWIVISWGQTLCPHDIEILCRVDEPFVDTTKPSLFSPKSFLNINIPALALFEASNSSRTFQIGLYNIIPLFFRLSSIFFNAIRLYYLLTCLYFSSVIMDRSHDYIVVISNSI